MSGWWVTTLLETQGSVFLCAWIGWVIISIVLHELAHGWMALRCGDRTPIETGHWTWNPLVHMGWMSILLFALLGLAWGAMPVDPTRFRRKYDDALVSLAGPLMNVLLALICFVAWAVLFVLQAYNASPIPPEVAGRLEMILDLGMILNITLVLLNLLPVPPLDGSRILSAFVPAYRRLFASETGSVLGIIVIVVLLNRGGGFIFTTGRSVVDAAQWTFAGLIAPQGPSSTGGGSGGGGAPGGGAGGGGGAP